MKILVTGASGFIGGRFARFALEQGLEVRVNSRRSEAVEHLVRRGAHFMPGDLSDADLARRLCIGVDAVVHCAGAVPGWGRRETVTQANVQLTENMVEACLKERVQRLVYLSSSSLYFDGQSHLDIKENQRPRRFHNHDGGSKYLAEQKVFGAAEFGLEVLALRPGVVVGAGDTRTFPKLLQLHHKHRLAIVGNGLNKADFTSVHNLNQALLNALTAAPAALGKAYNISNGVPVPIWDVVNYVLRQLQLTPVTRYCSFGLAYSAALLNEGACLAWPGRPQPMLTRLGMQIMNKEFTLDIARARHHLDYDPTVSLWDALDEFCSWWTASEPVDH